MSILDRLKDEIKSNAIVEVAESSRKFSKEHISVLGVKTPLVRKISAKYFKEVKTLEKAEIMELCDQLMKTEIIEYMAIAQDWFFRLRKKYSPEDFNILERWLKNHINNWGTCDDFCTHSIGYFMLEFPEFTDQLEKWAKSSNRWERRAAAVSLIYPVRREKYLDKIFHIAGILLTDKDDLVQKGYGWMLKVAADKYRQEVFDFVMKHKDVMPRTALRYAIEKMPPEMKKEAMKKG